ncbi:uncharacterized protein LOC130447479 [Diorhabda sublineata]|uniref:uncharacterized protein LOC130447479 n=1 Tax=Diorhabda sublineata TaxID=1163346 RepID=UPI0024E154D7|nr:uncharacterized protein LOC130447479 [Diorhabda sublineata]
MNLNECIVNPKKKSEPTFVITAKAGDTFKHDLGSHSFTNQISSATKWGSGCISVLNSSSTRKTTSSKITDENQLKIIVALTEGRGQAQCEVGIAVISVSRHHLIICQISDSQNYINTLTKINLFNPNEIIFPSTFENFGGNRLITKVKKQFPNVRYTGVPRSMFNKAGGLEMLTQLCIPSLNGVLLVLQHRYYALAAASALLTYVQDNFYIYYARESLKIDYQESEGYAHIDISTADRLELVCSAKPALANKFSSLLGILNYCLTKSGSRKLRSWILQPLSKVQFIEERLDCIEELMRNRDALRSIQAMLQKFTNINALLNLATLIPDNPQKCSIRQLNYIITLNPIIDLICPLEEILSGFKQSFFMKLRATLGDPSFGEIKSLVREVISDCVQPTKGHNIMHSRCFAIKPGVNGLLDVVRKIFAERLNDMKEYIEELAEKYNLPLTSGNNQKKGYHIILNIPKSQRKSIKKSDLPDEFIEINRCSTYFTMKTPELINMSTRLDDIMMDILKISNVIVHGVLVKLKKHIYLFHTLYEEIAQLDVYQSLAQTSLENNYVRPKFGEYTEIKFGQHPLLNFLLRSKPIANSIFCSNEYNVHIINGPNGSGKSIFIRQIMLLQIMAQLGCYIPAESAIFKPANRMFARIYLEDNMEYNASSFVLEMKEMKYIMSSMTDDSLIIIDELGRSTSVEEGISLAVATLEHLSCFSSYTYITTHFMTLSKLHLMYPNIKTWQMETVPIGNDPKTFQLDYRYNLIPGITSVPRYGVYLVRNLWPDSIVENIDRCLDNLEKQQREFLFSSLDPKFIKKYQLESDLKHLKRLGLLTQTRLNQLLVQYQADLKELNYYVSVHDSNNRTDSEEKILNNEEYEQINSTLDILQEEQAIKEILTPLPDNTLYPDNFHNFPETDIFGFSPRNEFQCYNGSNSRQHSENSDFIKLLHPVVTINEIDEKKNMSSSQNTTYLSSIVSPEEYQSICDEFEKDFELPHPTENLNYRNKQSESPYNVMATRNSYKYYMSPVIVNINDGLNNTSSFDDDGTGEDMKENSKTNKINVISNILIQKKNESIENINTDDVNGNFIAKSFDNSQKNISSFNNIAGIMTTVEESNKDLSLLIPDNDENIVNDETKTIPDEEIKEGGLKDVNCINLSPSTSVVNNTKNNGSAVAANEEAKLLSTVKNRNKIKKKLNIKRIDCKNKLPLFSRKKKVPSLCHSIKNESTNKEIVTECVQNIINSPIPTGKALNDNYNDNDNAIEETKYVIVDAASTDPPNPILNDSSIALSIAPEYRNNGTAKLENKSKTNDLYFNQYPGENKSSSNITSKSPKSNFDQATEIIKENDPCESSMSVKSNSPGGKIDESINIASQDEETDLQSEITSSTKIVPIFRKQKQTGLNTNIKSGNPNAGNNNYKVTDLRDKKIKRIVRHTVFKRVIPSSKHPEKQIKESSLLNANGHDSTPIPDNSSMDILAASKYRNLDQVEDESTSTESKNKTNQLYPSPYPSSNISSASRKRNLDQATETSAEGDESKQNLTNKRIDNLIETNLNCSSNLEHETNLTYSKSSTKIVPIFKRIVKKKRSTYSNDKENLNVSLETSVSIASKNRNLDIVYTNSDSNSIKNEEMITSDKISDSVDTCNKNSKRTVRRTTSSRFLPLRKLSAKKIKEEFAEQDRKLLESEFDLTKYFEDKFNRPSVKQIQNATHLATLRKTARGFEVISSSERRKSQNSMTGTCSNDNFNMTIFSDRNAKTFEQFINSKETNFQNFPFDAPKQAEELTFSFDKNANENVFDYYIENSTQLHDQNNTNISLTPNGYYKQNKSTIDAVMNKYLNISNHHTSKREEKTLNFNIFGNNQLKDEDFNL